VFWVFKSSDTFGKNVMVEVAKNLQVIGTIKCHLWVSLYARAIQFAQTHEFVLPSPFPGPHQASVPQEFQSRR
jgi:hypothetical protein